MHADGFLSSACGCSLSPDKIVDRDGQVDVFLTESLFGILPYATKRVSISRIMAA